MIVQAKEFQMGSGRWGLLFPDLLGTGKSTTIIQKALGLTEVDFCVLLENYGAFIYPSVQSFVCYSWDETDLAKCRKFKNWLNKEFRTRKVKLKEVLGD